MEVKDIRIVEAFEIDKPSFPFEKSIMELLEKVPKIDLRGIGKINLVGFSHKLHDHDETSNHRAKDMGNPAFIELCVGRILETMPEGDRTDKESLGAHLAYALYKAVGYNMLQFKHGVARKKQDGVAMGYARKYLAIACPGWKVTGDGPVKE